MRVELSEKVSPRFIYIDEALNLVHLLVPLVGGQQISTDNTCKSTAAFDHFFEGNAVQELEAYKADLEKDIQGLVLEPELQFEKKYRLEQVEMYLNNLQRLQNNFWHPHNSKEARARFLGLSTNLHSIQLRPSAQDPLSVVHNPVFSVTRTNSIWGEPSCQLYNSTRRHFPRVNIAQRDLKSQLKQTVIDVLPQDVSFNDILICLRGETQRLLNVDVDFNKTQQGDDVTEHFIKEAFGYSEDEEMPRDEIIDALFGYCAPTLFENLPESLFYTGFPAAVEDRTEKFSIMLQFFLAHINIYYKTKHAAIRDVNFGQVLSHNRAISEALLARIIDGYNYHAEIERVIFDYMNGEIAFGINHALNEQDFKKIKERFEVNYRTVNDPQQNPHMDDFMILDLEDTGPRAKVVTHQGSICIHFAELMAVSQMDYSDPDYLNDLLVAFYANKVSNSLNNDRTLKTSIKLNLDDLITQVSDEAWPNLSLDIRQKCERRPLFVMRSLINQLLSGSESDFIASLKRLNYDLMQRILTTTFSSGEHHNTTFFEVALSSVQVGLAHQLARLMNQETKAHLLERLGQLPRWQESKLTPLQSTLKQQLQPYSYTKEQKIEYLNLINFDDVMASLESSLAQWKKDDWHDKYHVLLKMTSDLKNLKKGFLQNEIPYSAFNKRSLMLIEAALPSLNAHRHLMMSVLKFVLMTILVVPLIFWLYDRRAVIAKGHFLAPESFFQASKLADAISHKRAIFEQKAELSI